MAEIAFDRIRMKEALMREGMTQKELAKAVGLTEVTISRYVSGERAPHGPNIVAIAEALNVSAEYLCGDGEGEDEGEASYMKTRKLIRGHKGQWTQEDRKGLIRMLEEGGER